jgi:DNA-binding transcriptional regulator YiaG
VKPRDIAEIARIRADLRSGVAKLARETAYVTQTEMARALGVTPAAVSQWESGKRTPNGARALAYARLLDRLAEAA